MDCPSCSGPVSPSDAFCRSCGALLASPSQAPTGLGDAVVPAAVPDAGGLAASPLAPSPVGRLLSSSSVPLGGFAPGTVLASRYRVIGLLGRGGMGEVYRADDLKLGQPVALKFLPKDLAGDAVRRERFFAEVRIARQVSHPNICRVYDIGEMEGRHLHPNAAAALGAPQHFLTMEFVDGEDLASLLKRIGSLHGVKALDVSRQLCAGLAAAHDKGVLHRDLKPANVMLDGRGHVRITDFGLAVAAGEDHAITDISGTPAYMAPEQFAGKGASVRSDIYALGLVLYEIYTGRRAFRETTLGELSAAKEGGAPPAPSEIVRDIDPIVERVILRCLEKDPRQRPASVAHVAAALPGGDPLAAAIAAGETPSPEMVAAAGSTEGLRPWVAWLLLGLTLVSLGASVLVGSTTALLERVPIDKEPAVMLEMARDILRTAGNPGTPADSAWGFSLDSEYFQWAQEKDDPSARSDRLPDSTIRFWYRQSPRPIVSWTFPGKLDAMDPVPLYSGEATVVLDARGHVTDLDVVPPQRDRPAPPASPAADWPALFKAAGLDPAKWTPAEPEWVPPSYADARAAWTGMLLSGPRVAARIEAAAYRGRPVAWHVIAPWTGPTRMTVAPTAAATRAAIIIGLGVLLIVAVGAVLFARRNLRMGRGDRRGATRLALGTFAINMVSWIVGIHHVADVAELYMLLMAASFGALVAGFVWLLYVALEPHVRRRWPNVLIAWTRLLAGNLRDPLVGRDVLVGCLWGAVALAARNAFGGYALTPGVVLPYLTGFREILSAGLDQVVANVFVTVAFVFLLLIFRVVLRRQWAAYGLFLLVGISLTILSPNGRIATIFSMLYWAWVLFVLVRFGPVACAVGYSVQGVLRSLPITTHLDAWYAGDGLVGLALLVGLAGYAFYTSLGGQPLFGRLALDD